MGGRINADATLAAPRPGDQPVEPHAGAHVPQVASGEQHDRHVEARVHRQVERVGGRHAAARFCARAFDEQRVIQFAEAPEQQPGAHREPGGALLAGRGSPRQHRQRRAEHQDVVDAVVRTPRRVLCRRSRAWCGARSTPNPPIRAARRRVEGWSRVRVRASRSPSTSAATRGNPECSAGERVGPRGA